MGDTGTTKDGFVCSDSLVRLAWTEWSVHHLEREEVSKAGSPQQQGLFQVTPVKRAPQPTCLFYFNSLSSPSPSPTLSPSCLIYSPSLWGPTTSRGPSIVTCEFLSILFYFQNYLIWNTDRLSQAGRTHRRVSLSKSWAPTLVRLSLREP
jgi:hypothetical protein